MKPIVVPVNDAAEAETLARLVIDRSRAEPLQVHLLNVQRPLPLHIAQFFARDELAKVHREAGMGVLAGALRLLADARVACEPHVLVGKPAETIVRFAADHGDAEILLDNASTGLLSRLGVGSIASQVRHLLGAHAGSAAPQASGR
ncbi:MAG TPA: universal stress protein [Casimicrobiaceae bacterium]|nr:universal stress protein [Casimicrobiaceae bacterium]